ncbi:hypothetical protein Tco_1060872 [Tanacetum coccineum]
MPTQKGMVNEGIAYDAGLDSKASTDDHTSTEQRDESGSIGYVADVERAWVDKAVFDTENAAIGSSFSNNTLTEDYSNNDTFENGLGFEIQNDVETLFIMNKAKGLTPSLYNIDEMGKDLPSDHKIISEEELKCEAEKFLRQVQERLCKEFEPLAKNINLQLNRFEKSLVKEMKDDLKYVVSLEDEFDEKCLILDIKTEFFKTQFESAIPESYSHVHENEMFEHNPSLENENRCLKKTVAQYQQDFSKLEAHCINLELKCQNQSLISGKHGQMLNETSNEAKIKTDIHVIESINIELECKVAKLLAENEHLKAQIQQKVFATTALENELRKSKGNSVDTKFVKPSILGKPPLQPLRNQSVVRQPNAFKSERPKFSKQQFASQVDVNNDFPKPVTPYYWPKLREHAFAKPYHMIASRETRNSSKNMPRFSLNDMVHNHYLEEAKKKTQEREKNSKTRCLLLDYKTLLMVANQNLGARIK